MMGLLAHGPRRRGAIQLLQCIVASSLVGMRFRLRAAVRSRSCGDGFLVKGRARRVAGASILILCSVAACSTRETPATGEHSTVALAGSGEAAASNAAAVVSRACGDVLATNRTLRARLEAADAGSARAVVADSCIESLRHGPSAAAVRALECVINLGDDTAYHRALLAALTMSVDARSRSVVLDDEAASDRAELARREDEVATLRAQIAANLDGSYVIEGVMEAERAPREYEVAPYGWPTRAILRTSDTVFSTRGRFSLRVVEVSEVQVKLSPALGGFTQQWKVLEEVVDDVDSRRRIAALENEVAFYQRRVEEAGSARAPGPSIEERATAWFTELRGLASPTALPNSAEVAVQRLDDNAALRPPPGLVESFLVAPLEDLASCCNESPYTGASGGGGAPDWGMAQANVRLVGAVAPALIEQAIMRDGNPGAAAALAAAPPLAERLAPALRAAQASGDAELKLQGARSLVLTGLADERSADALLDVIGLAARPDTDASYYAGYFAATALEGLREVKAPTQAQVARLRGFREFASTNGHVERSWAEVLRGWDPAGEP